MKLRFLRFDHIIKKQSDNSTKRIMTVVKLNSITQKKQQEEWILNMTIDKLRSSLRERIEIIEQLRSERDILIKTLGRVQSK